jgi:hypothetical protein
MISPPIIRAIREIEFIIAKSTASISYLLTVTPQPAHVKRVNTLVKQGYERIRTRSEAGSSFIEV